MAEITSEALKIDKNLVAVASTGIIGVELPMAGFSNANLGFEFGSRGEKSKSFVQENFFAFRV